MKKIILSLAMLAMLTSCNKKDNATPDYPTTDIVASVGFDQIVIAEGASMPQDSAEPDITTTKAYLDGVKVTAKSPYLTIDNTIVFGTTTPATGFTLKDIGIGMTTFKTTLIHNENHSFVNSKTILLDESSVNDFINGKLVADCNALITENIAVSSDAGTIDLGGFIMNNGAAKLIFKNDSNQEINISVVDGDTEELLPQFKIYGNGRCGILLNEAALTGDITIWVSMGIYSKASRITIIAGKCLLNTYTIFIDKQDQSASVSINEVTTITKNIEFGF